MRHPDTLSNITMPEEMPQLAAHHRMPDVLIIGAAKSATTLVTRWIAQHPGIGLCGLREPNFFSHPDRFVRGLDWYSDLFGRVSKAQLALDSSTGYTQWPQFPQAADRISHYAPEARLIYLMRHPVDRAYSHFIHRWTKETHPGELFVKTFEEYISEDLMCIDGSDYRKQLEQYLQHYSADDILCLFTFEVRSDPIGVLQKICRFLDLDDDPAPFAERPTQSNRAEEFFESRVRIDVTDRIKRIPGVRHLLPRVPRSLREQMYALLRHSSLGRSTARRFEPPPMKDVTRRRLIERFADSNRWVAEFSGQDLTSWFE